MDQDPPPQTWDPVLPPSSDDFANFLDFGDLNFSAFVDEVADSHDAPPIGEHHSEHPMDQAMDDAALQLADDERYKTANGAQRSMREELPRQLNQISFDPNAMQYAQARQNHQGQFQQHWHMPDVVPPTPNSMDLQAGHLYASGVATTQAQQQFYEAYRQLQKNQMAFTPLVSPAVTPLETQIQNVEGVSEAFSPLTSPALRAQNATNRGMNAWPVNHGSRTAATSSPLEFGHDPSAPAPASATMPVRKSRRRMSTSSAKAPSRSVKQSPAMKPQHKKKQTASAVIPSRELTGILESENSKPESGPSIAASESMLSAPDSSAVDSVSPESLSEILMPPPATPRSSSASKSPYLNAKDQGPQTAPNQADEPATPASLMRLRKQAEKSVTRKREASHLKEQAALAEANMEQIMDAMDLPEATAARSKKPTLRSINTTQPNQDTSTADTSGRVGIASAPATSTTSTFASPSVNAVASPGGTKARKPGDTKPKGRESKKRGSIGSEKASPALRPRISPSIKPLLPEGASVSPETSALLLASKSNYQNIIEGTHFPGVSYPDNLSTNLTSKRTSHKIAEQGRRNRINTALQEIAMLLPPTSPAGLANGQSTPALGGLEKDSTGGTSATSTPLQQGNSKASTVEAAIDYIRTLQQELQECKVRLAKYEDDPSTGVAEKEGEMTRHEDRKDA